MLSMRRILLCVAFLIPFGTAIAQVPVSGCSAAENQLMAQYMPAMTQAFQQRNWGLFKALGDEVNPKLSANCQNAIMVQTMNKNKQPSSSGGTYAPGTIQRHSDGGLSNGSVYCGKTGCTSLK